MESVEHSLKLKDGRTLAYHTFQDAEDKVRKSLHPVLYFHGFPGCGLEAEFLCASSVADNGGLLYAIDRPGMGKTSSPYGSNSGEAVDPETNLRTFINNVWELIEDLEWDEFSVIGVSGGGPYTLAFLASYLQRRQDDSNRPAILRNVSLVAAACVSAGCDGMKEDLAQLTALTEKSASSRWASFLLGATAASMGPLYNYFLWALPFSWSMYLISYGTKDSCQADKDFASDETVMRPFVSMMSESMVAQGGYPGCYDDGRILMRKDLPHEDFLRKIYSGDMEDLPAVGIFQGNQDINIPPSHARYLHESIFSSRSVYFGYEGFGHLSTAARKSPDYAAFAITGKAK